MTMRLRCISNQAADLDEGQRGRNTGSDVVYDLTVGRWYEVVGVLLWETMLWLLVRDDLGDPMNAPAGLFERSSVSVPAHWKFRIGGGARLSGQRLWADPLVAACGYEALIDDRDHLEALFEDNDAARDIFVSQFDHFDEA